MKYELLAPAGDMECLKWAIEGGCDAVYLGGNHFGARAYSKNFSDEELALAIKYAHQYGVKVYLTCNTLIYDEEVDDFLNFVRYAHKSGIDAVLIQDLGMYDLIHQKFPNLEIHASTQLHIHNFDGALVAKKLGFKRIVLARETDIDTIKEIKEKTGLDIEVFVHGSLCVSYSGQCLFSSLVGGRSGNRGACAGSCRLPYDIVDKNNIVLNKTKKYPLSMKDLCAISSIGKLMDIGVNSFKIEGRMKSKEYVYLVTKLYRKAIDSYLEKQEVTIDYEILDKLKKVFNREYTLGFLNNVSNNDVINGKQPNNVGVKIGTVVKLTKTNALIKLEDELHIGDGLRIKGSVGEIGTVVNDFYLQGNLVKEAKAGMVISLPIWKKPNVLDEVFLTSSKYIGDFIACEIEKNPRKVMLTGSIILHKKEKIIFKLSDGLNNIELNGPVVDMAKNRPLTKDTILEKLTKLGGTVYQFSKLDISLDDDIFVPLTVLNELRREAINILNTKRENIPDKIIEKEYEKKVPRFTKEANVNACVFKDSDIDSETKYQNIYSYQEDTKYIKALPNVIDKYPDDLKKSSIKPILISEIGGLNLTNIHTDYSLNVVNSYTVAFLHSMGVKKITLSYEMTLSQIKTLIEKYQERYGTMPNIEVIVYGYIKIMTLKYNLFNDYKEAIYLKDRFNNSYRIRECRGLTEVYYSKILDNRNFDYFSAGVNHIRYNLYKF